MIYLYLFIHHTCTAHGLGTWRPSRGHPWSARPCDENTNWNGGWPASTFGYIWCLLKSFRPTCGFWLKILKRLKAPLQVLQFLNPCIGDSDRNLRSWTPVHRLFRPSRGCHLQCRRVSSCLVADPRPLLPVGKGWEDIYMINYLLLFMIIYNIYIYIY